MNQAQRTTEFAVFCIENTAARLGVSGREVFRELNRTDGINRFLFPSYPTLHTQGKDYIVDETLQYIRRHNPTFGRRKGARAGDGMNENPLINETLLQMKYGRIVSLLAETLGVDEARALDVFYNSDTYGYLSQKMFHLHNMSDAYLVDEIVLELQNKQ